jgi:hypothetical protein
MVISSLDTFDRAVLLWNTWGKNISRNNMTFVVENGINNANESQANIPILEVIDFSNHTTKELRYRYSQYKWMHAILMSIQLDAFDWLILLDDDTFIIHNAMKNLLMEYNQSESLLIGKMGLGCDYLCGGAGFALSVTMVQMLKKYEEKLLQSFFLSINTIDKFYSDIILSHFIRHEHIGKLKARTEFKNYSPQRSLIWYTNHNITPSAVVSFHRIHDVSEYRRTYKYYYLT